MWANQQHGQEAAGKLFHYEVDTVNQVQKKFRGEEWTGLMIFCRNFFWKLIKDYF